MTTLVVVVVLLMLALPGPASELLNVEKEVNVFPLACAKISLSPCMPNPNGLNRDDVRDVLG